MKLCRFENPQKQVCIGLALDDNAVLDLTAVGIQTMGMLLERADLPDYLAGLAQENLPRFDRFQVKLLSPVERQEVWAAGVTYMRSKRARMDESAHSASAYDLVYEAERPELFFKSLPEKVIGHNEPVGIRKDSSWNVPEPELALVINSSGQIVGCTIGNDMSSRDIEGKNLLYLPQAKTYNRSCAVGPFITVGATEEEARSWTITLEIERDTKVIFKGETAVGQIKRSFRELAAFLFRSQVFPNGVVLLTGTGIVPEDDFTLRPNDRVRINISGIGTLENPVIEV